MSAGSLKSLNRSLDQLFSSDILPQEIPEDVGDNIRQYLSKHNTLELNNSTKLSDALYTLYTQRITADFKKEKLFIKVLILLVPNITQLSEFLMWIKKYLKISMDSAGHDIALVEASKELIISTMKCGYPNASEIECKQDLLDMRISHSNELIHTLIDSYMNPESLFDIEQQKKEESHEMEERKRFIKVKIRDVLIEYAVFDRPRYSKILNEYLVNKKTRLTASSLLSFHIAAEDSTLKFIPETQLLSNVMNVLSYDESNQSVYFALNLLVMVIPHVAHRVPVHFKRLFEVYSRLVCWPDKSIKQIKQNNDTVTTDNTTNGVDDDTTPTLEKPDALDNVGSKMKELSIDWDIMQDEVPIEGLSPDPSKLAVLLYGLLPLSFVDFIKNPTIASTDVEKFKRESLKSLKNFTIHENFFKYSSPQEELDNFPDFINSMSSPEDIKSFCFQYSLNDIYELSPNDLSLQASPTTIPSPTMTRNSSISTDLESKSPLSGLSSTEFVSNNDNIQQPLFKTPDYNLNSTANGNGNKSSNSLNNTAKLTPGFQSSLSTGNTNVIDSLLDTHKQLFFKNDTSVYTDFIRRHSVQTSIPDSDSTYSSNAANSFLTSMNDNPSSATTNSVGSGQSLDFYRRELMILMNELDFQMYIKNGSFQLIQQLRAEQRRLLSKLDQLKSENEHVKVLKLELKRLQEELSKRSVASTNGVKSIAPSNEIINSVTLLKQEKRALEGEISLLQAQLKESENILATLRLEIEPTKVELSTLSNKVVVLEGENDRLRTDLAKVEQEKLGKKNIIKEKSFETLSQQERKIHFLNEQLSALVDSHEKSIEDMKSDYMSQIDTLKKELTQLRSGNVQKSNHMIMNLKANYESKIETLSSSIYQLQEDIKRKETELIKLKTTKPINIPISSNHSIHSQTRSVHSGKPLLGVNFDRANSGTSGTNSGNDVTQLYSVDPKDDGSAAYFGRHPVHINDQAGIPSSPSRPHNPHQGYSNSSSHPFLAAASSQHSSQNYISKLGSKPNVFERDPSPTANNGHITPGTGPSGIGAFYKRPASASQPTTDTAPIVVKGRGGVQKNPRLKM